MVKRKRVIVGGLRSTRFDLVVPDDKYKEVINSIRLYRAICRKTFSACAMAEMAGASIEVMDSSITLSPNKEAARNILKTVFNTDDRGNHLYQLRDFILNEEAPSWMSFVWDSMRKDVSSLWYAKDPKIKASRGWLLMQGARGVGIFQRRGIGFPSQQNSKLEQHKLTLKWDHVIGPVEFGLKKLDGGRYHVWKGLRDTLPGWVLGTSYLSEDNGKIFVIISHECPITKKILDPANALEITFTEDRGNFITMKGPGNFDGEFISAEEVTGILEQIKIRKDRWESRRQAIGNPRRAWGSKKIWRATQEVINRNTDHRENVIQTRNHLWTRRIVDTAVRWNCGAIKINPVPEGMFGEPWKWSQFKLFLAYKAKDTGCSLIETGGSSPCKRRFN